MSASAFFGSVESPALTTALPDLADATPPRDENFPFGAEHAATTLDGYMMGFTINAVVLVASGLLGLALLWPNTERARLLGQEAVQPKFA